MKTRIGIISSFVMIYALAAVPRAASAMTLEASLAALDSGASGTRRLVVKKFGRTARISVTIPQTGDFFKPLFETGAVEALRAYESLRFETPLSLPEAHSLIELLYTDPAVESAYFEPFVDEAIWRVPQGRTIYPWADRAAVPNFQDLQIYLKAAPEGIDAEFAWTLPGGTGTGVRLVDVERGWHSDHLDFDETFWTNGNNMRVEHGTAVWGEIAAKPDGKGVTGISYGVDFGTAGVPWNNLMDEYIQASPAVYEEASRQLRPGDILMIEQQATGPDHGMPAPMEFWDANFDAIRSIVERGVIVVAAAGNGGSDLDHPSYNRAFDRMIRDSGAILVGAGGPPGFAHLERMDFSNYGKRIDAFGYGDGVVTTGYGDLYSSPDGKLTYTRAFTGTSSATPMVAGTIANLQGVARAQGVVLNPRELRAALRSTGLMQRGDLDRSIGRFPNFRQLRDYFCRAGRIRCDYPPFR